MENEVLMATLRADNKLLKDEIDLLLREIHRTYLAQNIPDGLSERRETQTKGIERVEDNSTPRPNVSRANHGHLPVRPNF